MKELADRWAAADDATKAVRWIAGVLSRIHAHRWVVRQQSCMQKYEALAQKDRARFESEGGKKQKDKSGPKKPSSSYIHFWCVVLERGAMAGVGGRRTTCSTSTRTFVAAFPATYCSNDQREAVKKANPALQAKEIMTELGAEWKKLSAADKKVRKSRLGTGSADRGDADSRDSPALHSLGVLFCL
jgi:hypothetical protein